MTRTLPRPGRSARRGRCGHCGRHGYGSIIVVRARRAPSDVEDGDRLLKVRDAADKLAMSAQRLKAAIRDGKSPGVSKGGQWLVPQSFVSMVLYSARPGAATSFEAIAAQWFALAEQRFTQALSKAA